MRIQNLIFLIPILATTYVQADSPELFHDMGTRFAQLQKRPNENLHLGSAWYAGQCVEVFNRNKPRAGLLGFTQTGLPIIWFSQNLPWVMRKTLEDVAQDLYKNYHVVEHGSNDREVRVYMNSGDYLIYQKNPQMLQFREADNGDIVAKASCPDAFGMYCESQGRMFRPDEAWAYCTFSPLDRLIDLTSGTPKPSPISEKPVLVPPPSSPQPVKPPFPEVISKTNFDPVKSTKAPQPFPENQGLCPIAIQRSNAQCPDGYSSRKYIVLNLATANGGTIFLGDYWFATRVDSKPIDACNWVKLSTTRKDTYEDIRNLHLKDTNNVEIQFDYDSWYKVLQVSENVACEKRK